MVSVLHISTLSTAFFATWCPSFFRETIRSLTNNSDICACLFPVSSIISLPSAMIGGLQHYKTWQDTQSYCNMLSWRWRCSTALHCVIPNVWCNRSTMTLHNFIKGGNTHNYVNVCRLYRAEMCSSKKHTLSNSCHIPLQCWTLHSCYLGKLIRGIF